MKKYFYLQLKLAARLLPFVLGVTVAMLLGLGVILSGLLTTIRNEEKQAEYAVALTGDTDNAYMQWGLAALDMGEDSQFSVSVLEMSQQQAHAALETGKISAYVILPEGLMEKALAGEEFEPITYVTSAGIEGISGYLKREVTSLVTKMVVYSQKGAYGLDSLLSEQVPDADIEDHMTALSLRYADRIIHRDSFYKAQVLGVSDGLSTVDYYICAVMIILLMLMGLPFAAVYIKRDHALSRMLRSRGFSAAGQLLCEYGAHLICMTILCGFLLVFAGVAFRVLPDMQTVELPNLGSLALRLLPVLLMISALNMLIFTLADNIVSGLLLHFFGTIGLCYVSGCIYPISAFPTAVQKVAGVLPTGIARQYIAGGSAWGNLGGLAAYTVIFLGIALLVRRRKTSGIER